MRKTAVIVVAGMATTLAVAVIWHGPLGGSDRFASYVDGNVEQTLRDYEMTQIQAQLHQAPLRRTIVLSGPADNFQRGELVRILDAAPGVADVHWVGSPAPARLPLLAEAVLSALAGFALGLVLSYLLELRRRSRSEWRW